MKRMKLLKISLIILLMLVTVYQAAIIDRTKNINKNAPIITSKIDEIEIPCQYEKKDLLQGLTAYDVEDGYITDKILIGGFSNFTERGVSSLDYAVYDKDGNIAIFKRKVVFTDYAPPTIKSETPWAFRATNNDYNIPSLKLKGWDMLDGDISKHVRITSEDLDFSVPGKYTASVNLKNSFGDEVNMDLPVHILDPRQSGISIELTEPIIYVKKGAVIKPEDYIISIRYEYSNEIIPDDNYELKIESYVDTSKDGICEIKYSAISSDKVQRGETWMTIIVGDYGG